MRQFRNKLEFRVWVILILLSSQVARADLPFQFEFLNGIAELPVSGFVSDVPLLLSPRRRILVVPEQSRDGRTARITIITMDPETGRPFTVTCRQDVPGLLEGYPPRFIVDDNEGAILSVPYQSKDGGETGVLFLTLDSTGYRVRDRRVTLGDLRYRPRKLGAPAYSNEMFYAENGAGTSRALVRVGGGRGTKDGWMSLVCSDDRNSGDANVSVTWMSPLAPGVEPAFVGSILVYPTGVRDGADVLFVSNFDDPIRSQEERLKTLNVDARPRLDFTGFPRNAPFHRVGKSFVLIPVNGPGNKGDLLLVRDNGLIEWSLSRNAAERQLQIPAFPDDLRLQLVLDVDSFLPVQILVPVRNGDGAPDDLWIVDMHKGTIPARAKDRNPDLPPFRLATADGTRNLLTPVQLPRERSGLLLFRADMTLDASFVDPSVLGFETYAQPVGDYVPVVGPDGRTDFLFFNGPHLTAASSLRQLNPELVLNGYLRGVDPVEVKRGQYVFVAEASTTTGEARLRVLEAFGVRPQLIVATPGGPGGPGSLASLDTKDRTLSWQLTDMLGLVPGVGMLITPQELAP